MTKRLLSVRQAAEYVGSTPENLRNRIAYGDLPFPSIKRGREVLVDQQDPDLWIDRLPQVGRTSKSRWA